MYKLDTTHLLGWDRYENGGACSLQPRPPPQTVTWGPSHGVSLRRLPPLHLVMLSQTLFSLLGHARWHGTMGTTDLRNAVHRGVKIVVLASPLLACVSDVPILTNLVLPQATIRPCSGPVLFTPGEELCDGSQSWPRSMLLPRCLGLSSVRKDHSYLLPGSTDIF